MIGMSGKQNSESGFVSIVVTMIVIIVLTIIIIGFSQYSRREQRQALDRQLSTQAFYAAESGVNDARQAVANNYQGIANNGEKTNCGPDPSGLLSGTRNQIEGTNVQYTCLLIDPSPPDLQFSDISTNEPTIVEFTGINDAENPTPIARIEIYWQATDGSQIFDTSNYPNFPSVTNWTNGGPITGILRVNMLPVLGYGRDGLDYFQHTAFLYPSSGGSGNANYLLDPAQKGDIVQGNCNTTNSPYYCKVTMTTTTIPSARWYLKLNAIYHNVRVTIKVFDNLNNQLDIRGAQTLVDSTGKANDVLRRIQVRIPTRGGGHYPNFSVQSMSGICKQLLVGPNYGTTSAACTYP